MHLRTQIDGGTLVSTVELPTSFQRSNWKWETCIFLSNGDSDVTDSYNSEVAAIEGHNKWVAWVEKRKDKITLLSDTGSLYT